MDDLINEFISETVESLSELDVDLVKLEQNPEDQELLGKIFRLMHTIKGTCGFLGLPRLEKVAHAAENLLDLFRSGGMSVSQDSMTALFKSIDRVRFLVDEIEERGAEPEGDDQDVITQIEEQITIGTGAPVNHDDVELESLFEDKRSDNANLSEVGGAELGEEDAVAQNAALSEGMQQNAEKPPVSKETVAAKTVPQNTKSTEPRAAADRTPEFLRVQMTVLEDLINLVSELVLTRNQLLQLVRISDEDSSASAPLQRLNRIVSDLQEGVMKTRMQPIGNAWSKLPRIVRDLTMDLGKKINLDMVGEETELDRQVLEMIKDPLTHMVRNSCDHGVERPADRIAAGKAETGTIELKAYHEGGFIIVEINDDGKGLDAQKIGQKALEKGLIDQNQLENMSDKQLLQLIFKAGFSTAEAVTNVSGRGVGMDVVRTNIEKIGGTIDMDSKLGKGTSFKIQIPLTLAIISALILEIQGNRYAMPQLNIQELVRIQPGEGDEIEMINDRPVFRLRDRILPLIDSQALFGENSVLLQDLPDSETENNGKEQSLDSGFENKLIVVVTAGASHFGLVVDAIHDMEEIVIKSISSVLSDTKIFAGNTILGDGNAIMILDPAGIASRFEVTDNMAGSEAGIAADTAQDDLMKAEKTAMLVFQAGKGAPKAMPLALISRLQQFDRKDITVSGDHMIVKFQDELMPMYYVDPENQVLADGLVTSLVLADDVSDAALGLVIEKVVDIVEDHMELTTSTSRDGVIGSVTLNETVVDVVDIAYYLSSSREDFFSSARHQQKTFAPSSEEKPDVDKKASSGVSALIVDDSPFFRNMLKPILSAAGYEVTLSEDAVAAIDLHDKGKMFDVILSDIEMPEMTGYEFVEKMRSDSAWKDLPFIALTSHTTPQDVEYGYQKGFTKYIGKLDKDELIRTIHSVLSSK